MEKLQRALKNAREARAEHTTGQNETAKHLDKRKRGKADGSRRGENGQAVRAELPAIWGKLTPFEPNPDHLARHRVMTLNAQSTSNPFDILRTKVFLMMRENGWKRLAITSPTKSCGKTTVACNLAVGFSRQREISSMLFDFDLRRPGVAKMMGQMPPHSLVDLLNGDVSASQQMLRLRSNVALSMSRSAVHDPTQLLLAQSTSDALDDAQDKFDTDITIFDLPPMLVTDDARAFLKYVDCALIVARADQTKMNQLDVCEREVGEHTNVLGVVLNDCSHLADEDQYYTEY